MSSGVKKVNERKQKLQDRILALLRPYMYVCFSEGLSRDEKIVCIDDLEKFILENSLDLMTGEELSDILQEIIVISENKATLLVSVLFVLVSNAKENKFLSRSFFRDN